MSYNWYYFVMLHNMLKVKVNNIIAFRVPSNWHVKQVHFNEVEWLGLICRIYWVIKAWLGLNSLTKSSIWFTSSRPLWHLNFLQWQFLLLSFFQMVWSLIPCYFMQPIEMISYKKGNYGFIWRNVCVSGWKQWSNRDEEWLKCHVSQSVRTIKFNNCIHGSKHKLGKKLNSFIHVTCFWLTMWHPTLL